MSEAFKERVSNGESLDSILPEAYALVKNACRHLVGTTEEVCEPCADFHEPLPFTRDGSRKFMVSGVSKRELADISANVPYPDKAITAHARMLKKRADSSAANRKKQELLEIWVKTSS